MADDHLAEVLGAAQALRSARIGLQDAVDAARESGRTWQQIGDVLGMSRQAAFKRFGHPRTGDTTMTATASPTTPAATERVFTDIAAERWEQVRDQMTPTAAEVLTADLIRDTWQAALREAGELVRCEDTRVELPDGTEVDPDEPLLGDRIGVTRLVCEAGEWVGRVAWTQEGRIGGLLIVPPGSGPWPF